MNRRSIDSRRIREEEGSSKSQSGHETLRQAEGGSDFASNYQGLVDFY